MATRRGRRVAGLIPRAGRAVWRSARWSLAHPQPLVAVALPVACAICLWAVATRGDAFRVMEIRVPVTSGLRAPDSLMGQNLWAIDLRALAAELKTQEPQLKQVRVIRQLPNTLQVEIVERIPVGQVRLGQRPAHLHSRLRRDDSPSANMQAGGWYPVDGDGFILPDANPNALDGLIILKGVETPQIPLKMGRENASERLLLALRVAGYVRRSSALLAHRLIAVDVGDPRQITFVIDDDIEIRCGGEAELGIQLERLRAVLGRVARQALAIRYIDVRFADPVIGPRT